MSFSYSTWVSKQHWIVKMILVLALLYIFLLGINFLSTGFKTLGKDQAKEIINQGTNNPIVALFIGLLVTSLVQSSSTTTSLVVGLVGSGTLALENAVPMIMGANMGTTVTNTIASLGHITRKDEFERAYSAATVHDFFNIMTISVLFPLEYFFGILQKLSMAFTGLFEGGGGGIEFNSPIKMILKPVVKGTVHFLEDTVGLSELGYSIVLFVFSVIFIFFALYFITKTLKAAMQSQVESSIDQVLLKSGYLNIFIGMVVTVIVQSSSITTSVLVPLVAAGIITLPKVYPITLGANIGTTMTALIASSAGDGIAGLQIALVHLLFNLIGVLIFYSIPPLRQIPIWLAQKAAGIVVNYRSLAIVFLVVLFYVIPTAFILFDWYILN